MKFVELNHYIRNGLVSYPGMPPVEISAFMTREECGATYGSESAAILDQIKMVNISGTYIDAPYHRFEDGYKIGDIPLEKVFARPAFVVHMSDKHNYFDVEDLEFLDAENLEGAAVLLHSGYDKKFGTPEYEIDTPYLTVEGANWLMERKVSVVGIDTPLIDDYVCSAEKGNPVHDIILGALSVICEDMKNIEQLPDKGALFYAIPARVDMASFPARAFATIED